MGSLASCCFTFEGLLSKLWWGEMGSFSFRNTLLRVSAPSPELVITAKRLVTEESVLSAGEKREAVRNVRRVPGNAATQVYSHTSSCRCHEDRRLRLYACDCLSGALCLECTRSTADSGVFMCAVRRQLAPSGRGRVARQTSLWNLEPFLGPFHHHRRRDNTAFYPSSEAGIVRLLGICTATSAGLMSVIYLIFLFFLGFFFF